MAKSPFKAFGQMLPSESEKYAHGHKCPDCGSTMVERTNRATGSTFFGCSDFPDCTGTRNEDGNSKTDTDRFPEELDGKLRWGRDKS